MNVKGGCADAMGAYDADWICWLLTQLHVDIILL